LKHSARKLLLILAIVSVMAASCGGSDADSLVVYSGRSENLVGPLFERFTEETGITVDVRYGQSADLALLIDQEGENSPADVYISQSPGAVGLLAGNELLATLSDATLGLVAEDFRNASGEWVGLSGRVRVLVYNSDLVDESSLPGSIFDLADAEYQGRVALAPGNGSFQDFVTGMREIHGDDTTLDWLNALETNGAVTYANNSAIVQAVGRGEVELGLVNHYYNLRALAEDPSLPSLNHFFDDVGSLVIITAAGVLESSQNSESSEELIQYLLGTEAQQFFSDETFEYPLANNTAGNAVMASLNDVQTVTYDFDSLSGGLGRTTELIEASGLEAP
jgi:iron(III) transport system substrate-binding protein